MIGIFFPSSGWPKCFHWLFNLPGVQMTLADGAQLTLTHLPCLTIWGAYKKLALCEPHLTERICQFSIEGVFGVKSPDGVLTTTSFFFVFERWTVIHQCCPQAIPPGQKWQLGRVRQDSTGWTKIDVLSKPSGFSYFSVQGVFRKGGKGIIAHSSADGMFLSWIFSRWDDVMTWAHVGWGLWSSLQVGSSGWDPVGSSKVLTVVREKVTFWNLSPLTWKVKVRRFAFLLDILPKRKHKIHILETVVKSDEINIFTLTIDAMELICDAQPSPLLRQKRVKSTGRKVC